MLLYQAAKRPFAGGTQAVRDNVLQASQNHMQEWQQTSRRQELLLRQSVKKRYAVRKLLNRCMLLPPHWHQVKAHSGGTHAPFSCVCTRRLRANSALACTSCNQ
jgi:phosphoserine aminotransferase